MKEKFKSKSFKRTVAVIPVVLAAAVALTFGIRSIVENKKDNADIATQISTNIPSEETTQEPVQEEPFVFSPHCTEKTDPKRMSIKTKIVVSGKTVENYQRKDKIDFGFTNEYSNVNGIITFRGNNFRDCPTYSTASLSQKKFDKEYWKTATGSLASGSGYNAWSGSGWTGQPLIVEWPDSTKNVMNMYKEKKEKKGLVEVIYATMGGKIYFLDLDDGSYTRDPIDLGFTFKGAGALDPRGYPLMYVGAGDYNPSRKSPRFYVISLIDGKVLKEYDCRDSFAEREWGACDSSPLVSAEADTLIYPCENGILYTVKLNTKYDEASGKLSVSPDPMVKFKFTTKRSNLTTYWYGMEDSAVVFGEYLYIADNGGNFLCINLNNMKVIWSQDTLDDTNCTPVLEREGNKVYLYISTSLHWTKNGADRGDIPIWKIDAETGEIVWKTVYNCSTVSGTSGGVQGTLILGKNNYSDKLFVPIAHYPNNYQGGLIALDKKTGKQLWYYTGNGYSWTSPSIVYDADGNGVIIHCDTTGDICMLDPNDGKLLDRMRPSGNIEASPAVYKDTIVVGSRVNLIMGIKIK